MSSPGPLFRPFHKLVKIELLGKQFEVPENNTVLRAMQYVAAERVSCGRFCWNQECQYCRIEIDQGEGTPTRTVLGCKHVVEDGLRIKTLSLELRYCLRDLLDQPVAATPAPEQAVPGQLKTAWMDQPS